MDRVLLVIDDIQYSRHLEMTLRKAGFDVESINNEFNLSESILTFNPDYIIGRGNTNRLSVQSLGRKLKESSSKFNGKVILIFPENHKISPEELIQLKVDLMLFDPMSTLKLAMHLFSFSENDFEFVKDKLLKFAITDNQFRNYEQQILKNAGLTIDSEIQVISSMDRISIPDENKKYSDSDLLENDSQSNMLIHGQVDGSESDIKHDPEPLFPQPVSLSAETIGKINEEIQLLEHELPLRIDTYNHVTKKTAQDLSIGHSKRLTKKASNKLHTDLLNEQKTDEKSEQKLHDEKIRFAQALFKKKS